MLAECYTPEQVYLFFTAPETMRLVCYSMLDAFAGAPDMSAGRYLFLLSLTCLLEAPWYFVATWLGPSPSWQRFLGILLTCNLATHPFICFGLAHMFAGSGRSVGEYLAVAETFAPFVEAILLWKLFNMRAIIAVPTAIAANIFSWWLGLIIL